jgi:hypothetical protein
MNLPRLAALPSTDEPLLVYLGVTKDKDTAVFLVDSGVKAQGDGRCKPNPSTCETIHLSKGETEFFDVTDADGNVVAQYQLDLVDIKRKRATAAAAARQESKAGRRAVRAHQSASGPLRYRYDVRKGTVRRLGAKAWKAVVAKAARAAKTNR